MKIIIRLLVVGIAYTIITFGTAIPTYDIIVCVLMVIGLIINYLKVDKEKYTIDAITNYIFWMSFALLILYQTNEPIFDVRNTLLLVLCSKILIIVVNYLKFKRVAIPSSIISKLWLFVLFVYLSELILNSTHNFKSICIVVGFISSIESLLIVLYLKVWRPTILSIFKVRSIVLTNGTNS